MMRETLAQHSRYFVDLLSRMDELKTSATPSPGAKASASSGGEVGACLTHRDDPGGTQQMCATHRDHGDVTRRGGASEALTHEDKELQQASRASDSAGVAGCACATPVSSAR